MAVPVDFLSDEQVGRYGRFAAEPSAGELEAFFRLTAQARELATAKRRPETRLGWAVQWGTVRMLGTCWCPGAIIGDTKTGRYPTRTTSTTARASRAAWRRTKAVPARHQLDQHQGRPDRRGVLGALGGRDDRPGVVVDAGRPDPLYPPNGGISFPHRLKTGAPNTIRKNQIHSSVRTRAPDSRMRTSGPAASPGTISQYMR